MPAATVPKDTVHNPALAFVLMAAQDTECSHALWVSCASNQRSSPLLLAGSGPISTSKYPIWAYCSGT
jgi:hypothetical protein